MPSQKTSSFQGFWYDTGLKSVQVLPISAFFTHLLIQLWAQNIGLNKRGSQLKLISRNPLRVLKSPKNTFC